MPPIAGWATSVACQGWNMLALVRAGGLTVLLCLAVSPLRAQTDYYNTDRGRPVQVEDAYVTERHAFELKLAPVRLERANGGVYNWGVEPEIAYGILPRTQVEFGIPLAYQEVGSERRYGVAGLDLSVMHNLNVETETWPALAVRADLIAPVGSLGPSKPYASFTSMGTRTFHWARFHLNAQYTAGPSESLGVVAPGPTTGFSGPGALDLSRWLVGGAIDKTYPLRALLLTAEFYGRKPLDKAESVEYSTGGGTRYQVNPTFAIDGGLGRRLNGPSQGWYITFGTAYAFGIRSLFPGGR